METKHDASNQRVKALRKVGSFLVKALLTTAGVILIPPLLEKVSAKRYKAALRKDIKHNK